MAGLYVHIPFCEKRCHYCDFVISVDRSEAARERFFAAFERELRWVRKMYGPLQFETFYLGGGTPSALSAEEMTRLVAMVQSHFEFKPGFEFTCEFNPGDVDSAKIKAFRDMGINRISLGAQAFQDTLLKAMGRMHTALEISETAGMIKDAGIQNVSFDIILGLPSQSLGDLSESLEAARDLGAVQFSLYDLNIHEKTVWGVKRKKNELDLPDESLRAQFFGFANLRLEAWGYVPYEVSTFAKPGFESRHNLIYWRNREYLGLGPGAFSYMKGIRYQMAPTLGRYLVKCETGDFQPDARDHLSDLEKETETLLTGLRLREGMDLESLPLIESRLTEKTQELVDYGVLQARGPKISLTTKGRFLAESVFASLVSALKE